MTSILDDFDDALIASLGKRNIQAGETLFHQGDVGSSMFVVLQGRLEARVRQSNGSFLKVGEIAEGDPVGEIQLLTGGRRTASVVAQTDTLLLELLAHQVEGIAREFPDSYQALRQKILHRLRRNQLMMLLPNLMEDFGEAELQELESQLEWIRLKKGETLLRQGDPGDALFIVVSGRLSVVHEHPSGVRDKLLEITRGETVGELSFLTDDNRSASVYAIRDSVLVKVSRPVYYNIIVRHPSFHNHITRGVMRRLQSAAQVKPASEEVTNIAIVPLDPHPTIQGCIRALTRAMSVFGTTLYLNRDQLVKQLHLKDPRYGNDRSTALRVSTWLDEQERKYKYVFLETDPSLTFWTRRAIQQADRILFIGLGSADPFVRPIEREVWQEAGDTPHVLVLLHEHSAERPAKTMEWLSGRKADTHLHIRVELPSDIDRLARFVAGRSIGLVFSGGGARGFAHIGVVRALQGSGIPIDMVGGSSMGATVAAHVAMDRSYEDTLTRTRDAFVQAKPFRRQIPVYSFYKGKKLDEVTHDILFQDHLLEDMWLPCFFVSSSLSTSEPVVHDRGAVWEAIRASTALPGVITPVSLNDHLHVDGGLLNNLPVDVMRKRCKGKIIAVDVSNLKTLPAHFKKAPNLLDVFSSRELGEDQSEAFPRIMEVLMRSMLLGSSQKTLRSREDADVCLIPPVDDFSLLEFEAIDQIVEAGYQYTKGKIAIGMLQEQLLG